MYQLSIIIPIYNGEAYFERLLKSIGVIPPSVELILVDNGSTDGSVKIIQAYRAAHPHTKVVFEKQNGVASARNAGLALAKGKYIWFIDADDAVRSDALLRILQIVTTIDFDLFIFNYQPLEQGAPLPQTNAQINVNSQKVGLPEILHEMLGSSRDVVGGFPHNKVFARDLIGSDIFPDCSFAEDLAFFVPILLRSKHIYRLHEVLYYYYQNNDSTVHQVDTKKLTDYAKVVDQIERQLRQSGLASNRDINEYVLRRRLSIFFQNLAGPKDPEIKKQIRQRMRQYSFKQLVAYRKDKKLMVKIMLYKLRILEVLPFLLKYVY